MALAIGFSLSSCDGTSNDPLSGNGVGLTVGNEASGLEALAAESGVIGEAKVQDALGSYGRRYEGSEDRLCVVPSTSGQNPVYQVGIEIHIGEEENCHGSGSARRVGDRLIFTLDGGRCVISAQYDGDQIIMPGAVDQACATLCSARGSLAGVSFPRIAVGASAGKAVMGKSGDPLCV